MINKIKKILKWLAILIVSGLAILFISIYISSLNSYKESDFNIPKDFFNTKYHDKDENSENNGFNDLVEFTKKGNKIEDYSITYYNFKSKCLFGIRKNKCDDESLDNNLFYFYNNNILKEIKQSNFEDNDIIKKYIYGVNERSDRTLNNLLEKKGLDNITYIISDENNKKLRSKIKKGSFLRVKSIIFSEKRNLNNISNKEFIKEYKDNRKHLDFIILKRYFEVSNYIAYDYFEKGKYNLGMKILLNNRIIIIKIIKKSDVNWLNYFMLQTLEKKNLEMINYFLLNYEVDEKNKEKIKNNFLQNNYNGLIINSIKDLYSSLNKGIDEMYNEGEDIYSHKNIYKNIYNNILICLFYSEKETKLLNKKIFYALLNKKNLLKDDLDIKNRFKVDLNLNNYYGRKVINDNSLGIYSYISPIKKIEKEILLLRKEILENLD